MSVPRPLSEATARLASPEPAAAPAVRARPRTIGGSELGRASQVASLQELGIAAITTDLDGTVLECNRAAADLYGHRQSDMLGVAIGTVRVAETDGVMAESIVRGLLDVGRWRGELEIEDANGLPLRLDVRARVVLDGTGRPVGFEAVFGDLRERVRAERRATESESRLRVADRIAGLGSWEWDPRADRLITSDSFTSLLGLAPGTELPMARALAAHATRGQGTHARRDRRDAIEWIGLVQRRVSSMRR